MGKCPKFKFVGIFHGLMGVLSGSFANHLDGPFPLNAKSPDSSYPYSRISMPIVTTVLASASTRPSR